MPSQIQTGKQPACPQKGFADQAASDFVPGESLKLQEYFVYFKASNCTNGAKDPASESDAIADADCQTGSERFLFRPRLKTEGILCVFRGFQNAGMGKKNPCISYYLRRPKDRHARRKVLPIRRREILFRAKV